MGKGFGKPQPPKAKQKTKTFFISESSLKQALEALSEVAAENVDSQEDAPQSPQLPENATDFDPCSMCGCVEAYAVESESIHWAEWKCIVCCRHRGWIENPANAAKRESENQLIDQLLQKPGLATWDRMFLRSIRNTRKRSPRQIQKLNEIAAKVGGDV